jgi:hypothetical protein
MKPSYPLPHSHAGRPVIRWSRPLPPLSETRKEVAAFSERNSDWKPMLHLYDRLCEVCGSLLYGSAVIGGGLILATRADVAQNEGVIAIYFDPSKKKFSLSYQHQDVHPEQSETCSESDIWERLRLYLGYKFGIRITNEEKKNGA